MKTLWEWGLCIWRSSSDEKLAIPHRVSLSALSDGEEPISIDSGLHYSLIVTNFGRVYVWGSSKSICSSLGVSKISQPTLIPETKSHPISMACCGTSHCVLASGNSLFFFGNYSIGKSYQTQGMQPAIQNEDILSKFETIGIHSIAAGAWVNAVILKDGSLWTWGWNKDGQTGHSKKFGQVDVPKQIRVMKNDQIVKFDKASFGYNWCLVKSQDCRLYAAGNNRDSQCGTKTRSSNIFKLQLIDGVSNVEQITCSRSDKYGHSAIVCGSTDGQSTQLRMFGSNYKGKLGLGVDYKDLDHVENAKDRITPFKPNVKKVTLGGIHSMILDTDGSIYTFGCGSDGRLGHPESVNFRYLYRELKPREIETLKGCVLDCSASYYHGVALCHSK